MPEHFKIPPLSHTVSDLRREVDELRERLSALENERRNEAERWGARPIDPKHALVGAMRCLKVLRDESPDAVSRGELNLAIDNVFDAYDRTAKEGVTDLYPIENRS